MQKAHLVSDDWGVEIGGPLLLLGLAHLPPEHPVQCALHPLLPTGEQPFQAVLRLRVDQGLPVPHRPGVLRPQEREPLGDPREAALLRDGEHLGDVQQRLDLRVWLWPRELHGGCVADDGGHLRSGRHGQRSDVVDLPCQRALRRVQAKGHAADGIKRGHVQVMAGAKGLPHCLCTLLMPEVDKGRKSIVYSRRGNLNREDIC